MTIVGLNKRRRKKSRILTLTLTLTLRLWACHDQIVYFYNYTRLRTAQPGATATTLLSRTVASAARSASLEAKSTRRAKSRYQSTTAAGAALALALRQSSAEKDAPASLHASRLTHAHGASTRQSAPCTPMAPAAAAIARVSAAAVSA